MPAPDSLLLTSSHIADSWITLYVTVLWMTGDYWSSPKLADTKSSQIHEKKKNFLRKSEYRQVDLHLPNYRQKNRIQEGMKTPCCWPWKEVRGSWVKECKQPEKRQSSEDKLPGATRHQHSSADITQVNLWDSSQTSDLQRFRKTVSPL